MEPPSFADDASLLNKIAKGDQTALSAFYDRYARIIYSVALKSLRSVEESEEVVLDVFAQVWRIADRYDVSKARADTWLFMLARSRVLDRVRKLQRRVPILADRGVVEIQIPASGVEPIEEIVISERRDRVKAALQSLPSEQRLVIELAYYQGLTQSEIASHTGMSLGTVKTRSRLGLNKLKTALAAEI